MIETRWWQGFALIALLLIQNHRLPAAVTPRAAVLTPERPSTIFAVAFSRDGKYLAAGGSNGTVDVWEHRTRKAVAHLDAHRDVVRSIRFTDEGEKLVTSASDGTVAIWNLKSKECERRIQATNPGGSISQFAIDSTATTIYTINHQLQIRRWKAPFNTPTDIPFWGHPNAWISPDGRLLITRGKGQSIDRINLDDSTREVLHQFDAPTYTEFCVAENGRKVAVANAKRMLRSSREHDVRIIFADGSDKKIALQLDGVLDMAMSDDGRLLSICGSDKRGKSNKTSVQIYSIVSKAAVPIVHKEGAQHTFSPRAKGICYATAVSSFRYYVAFAGTSGQVHVYRIPIKYAVPKKSRDE